MMRFKLLCGTHNEKGVIYKPGDVLTSMLPYHDIFPSRFQLLPDLPTEDYKFNLTPQKLDRYVLKSRERGWYDVVDSQSNNKMNEGALRKAEAEEIAAKLNG